MSSNATDRSAPRRPSAVLARGWSARWLVVANGHRLPLRIAHTETVHSETEV
jgi:hypothetical protein